MGGLWCALLCCSQRIGCARRKSGGLWGGFVGRVLFTVRCTKETWWLVCWNLHVFIFNRAFSNLFQNHERNIWLLPLSKCAAPSATRLVRRPTASCPCRRRHCPPSYCRAAPLWRWVATIRSRALRRSCANRRPTATPLADPGHRWASSTWRWRGISRRPTTPGCLCWSPRRSVCCCWELCWRWFWLSVASKLFIYNIAHSERCNLTRCALLSRTFGYAYTETSTKQPPLDVLCEPSMTANGKLHHHQAFLGSGTTMLYPSSTTTQTNQQMVALQQQMATENRLLWATLTPHGGTRHYVAESTYPLQDEHYEVIDFAATRPTGAAGAREAQQAVGFTEVSPQHVKRTPIKVRFIDLIYDLFVRFNYT